MKAIHPVMLAKGYMPPVDWEGNLSHLYYDLAGGASPEIVKTLLTITTPDHLLYGSNYPYQSETILTGNLNSMRKWLAEDAMLVPYAEKILHENACKLFNK